MDVTVRFSREDVWVALREHMRRTLNLQAPEMDDVFQMVSLSDGNFVVEVRNVFPLGPSEKKGNGETPRVNLDEVFANVVDDVEREQIAEHPVVKEEPSDFSDAATEASIQKMFQNTGRAAQRPVDGRPPRERFKETVRYASLEAAGKEDGDIADEIA